MVRINKSQVAPYSQVLSKGRRILEEPPEQRGEFQRDRDRIVHSAAFRRLEYKTQVFVNHEGDMFRTRLTHSIEVAQIGRSIARLLGVNEDLTEAIALAHDLGHTPFGHAGQDALNVCMKPYGGFEHNLQSLRVVDFLETRYADFDGLNLTFETREGILKHCSLKIAPLLGDVGERFLNNKQPGLEAQIANLADEIAYNNHDVDDGLRSELISLESLCDIPLFGQHFEAVKNKYPEIPKRRVIHEIIRRMINHQVSDLLAASVHNIKEAAPENAQDVRDFCSPLVTFSAEMKVMNLALKRFLREQLYQHYRVRRMSAKANRIISHLFEAFFKDPRLLPDDYSDKVRNNSLPEEKVARLVADYIAGMTDRFAIAEYERMFDPSSLT